MVAFLITNVRLFCLLRTEPCLRMMLAIRWSHDCGLELAFPRLPQQVLFSETLRYFQCDNLLVQSSLMALLVPRNPSSMDALNPRVLSTDSPQKSAQAAISARSTRHFL